MRLSLFNFYPTDFNIKIFVQKLCYSVGNNLQEQVNGKGTSETTVNNNGREMTYAEIVKSKNGCKYMTAYDKTKNDQEPIKRAQHAYWKQ